MKYEIPRTTILEALKVAGLNPGDLMEDYSGRGMFGRQCPALTVDRKAEVARFHTALGIVVQSQPTPTTDPMTIVDLAGTTLYDDFGRGIVAYWPDLTITEEPA